MTALFKKVAILQSNYIPWKGYFDLINMVDEFILYDDVQFTKNDWRNRNKIKTASGTQWLTIPVFHSTSDRIRDVKVSQKNWAEKHWKTIQANYGRAPCFREVKDYFEPLYRDISSEYLSDINRQFIIAIDEWLGIKTKISCSSTYSYSGDKSEKVLNLCKMAGADVYLSGPAAQCYLDVDLFAAEGIAVEWMDYSGYMEYPQSSLPFEHGVSIIDMAFNLGEKTHEYMKSFSIPRSYQSSDESI